MPTRGPGSRCVTFLVRAGERLLASGLRGVQGGKSREFLTSPESCTIDQAAHGEPTERLGRSPTWRQLVRTCEVEESTTVFAELGRSCGETNVVPGLPERWCFAPGCFHGVSEVKGSFRIAGSHGMIDALNRRDAWTEDRRFICEVGVRPNGGRLSLGEQIGRACRTTGQDRGTGRLE